MRIPLLLILFALWNGLFLAQVRAETNAPPKPDYSSLKQETVTVKVQKVIDPLTFLAESGTLYQFSGLDVPPNDAAVQAATKAVTELLDKEELRVYVTKDQNKGRVTRTNHSLITAERKKDDLWIQGRLIEDGLARVRTTASNPEMAAQMLALEAKARAEKKGIWAKDGESILTPDTAKQKINSFQIVEGKVFGVSTRNNEIFINFDTDWKKDFSIGIPVTMRRDLSKAFINPMMLSHKPIRVRGWLEDRNGPFISLDHVEQLEILDKTGKLPLAPSGDLKSTGKAPAKPEPDDRKPNE